MSTDFQVTFDAADPERLGRFWAEVLGYVPQPPPDGFGTWTEYLDSVDWPVDRRDDFFSIVDREGRRPRLLFERVPEGKTAKNRMHLDVNAGAGHDGGERDAVVRAEADRLIALGATELRDVTENGEHWIVLQDVEGNEFCVQ